MYSKSNLTAIDRRLRVLLDSARPEDLIGSARVPAAGDVARDYIEYLRMIDRPSIILGVSSEHGIDYLGAAKAWAAKLIVTYVAELRRAICGNTTAQPPKPRSRAAATGTVAGVASWLAARFGLTEPVSIAMAAVIIHTLASSGLRSSCLSTDQAVLEAIAKKYSSAADK